MFRQEARVWRYAATAQAGENFEKQHPTPTSGDAVWWWDCYEYRPSAASRLMFAVDLPTAILIGTSAYECAQGAVRPIMNKLRYHMRVKSRIILIECLLVLGILVQWWLVGRWLDRVCRGSWPTRRWIMPIAITTTCGILMIPAVFMGGRVAELVEICAEMIALLAWVVLLVMFTVVGATRVLRTIRH